MDAKDRRPAEREALVGRGGLKLLAALDRFSLVRAVKGARAVDVGASTGGFTQVLLEAGAAHVTAVDAGHGQLAARLRHDDRVVNLERTDWKRLSLDIAPGPFDFFTVDVSFVAARSMLRGLAFRLRDGAEGVVLLKPQFELPDALVRGGDVSAPALRRRTMDRFSAKAATLGFALLASEDSPVAGGEGTVEILIHLRFGGRPATLPRRGEKRESKAAALTTTMAGTTTGATTTTERPTAERTTGSTTDTTTRTTTGTTPSDTRATAARPVSSRRAELGGSLRWFAIVAPGAEEVAAREAARVLPDARVAAVAGGVDIEAPFTAAMRANLELRVPTRLLLRLGQARAREFGKLRHQLARLPWERFLPPDTPVRISASASHCRLYHTGGIDENVRAAIGDRGGAAPAKAVGDALAPIVLVRGVDDRWTVSVDSSGERLHRRGWRTDAHEAPMRETLAACLLALAEWEPGQALVDPMCGAGTIPIEACTAALGRAPGADRAFAFEAWPAFDAAARQAWEALRAEARARQLTTLAAPICASDEDVRAVAATRANAARAGVESVLRIDQQPVTDVEAPAASGLFIANPPYGKRLGTTRALPALYRQIGAVLRRRFRGWRAAVVVPDARLASAFQVPIVGSHHVRHGGLGVTLIRLAP